MIIEVHGLVRRLGTLGFAQIDERSNGASQQPISRD